MSAMTTTTNSNNSNNNNNSNNSKNNNNSPRRGRSVNLVSWEFPLDVSRKLNVFRRRPQDPQEQPLRLELCFDHSVAPSLFDEALLERYLCAMSSRLREVFVSFLTVHPAHQNFVRSLLNVAPKVTLVDFWKCQLTSVTGTALAGRILRKRGDGALKVLRLKLCPLVPCNNNNNNNTNSFVVEEPQHEPQSQSSEPSQADNNDNNNIDNNDNASSFVARVTRALDQVGSRGSLKRLEFRADTVAQLQMIESLVRSARHTLKHVQWIALEPAWRHTLGLEHVCGCLTCLVAQPRKLETLVVPAVKHDLLAPLLRILVETNATVPAVHCAYDDPPHYWNTPVPADPDWWRYLPQLKHLRKLNNLRIAPDDPRVNDLWKALRQNTSIVQGITTSSKLGSGHHSHQQQHHNNNTNNNDDALSWQLMRLRGRNRRIAQVQSWPDRVVPLRLWPFLLEQLQDYLWDPKPHRPEELSSTVAVNNNNKKNNNNNKNNTGNNNNNTTLVTTPLDPTPVFLFLQTKLPSWFNNGGGGGGTDSISSTC